MRTGTRRICRDPATSAWRSLHDTIVDPDQTIGVAESLGFDVRPQEPM